MSRIVLITGAGGFLGRHFAERFAGAGWRVRGLDLDLVGIEGVHEAVTGSVTDPAALARAVRGAHAVVHGAALTDLWVRDADAYDGVNHRGTAMVARAARATGARLVHISSFTTLVPRDAPKDRSWTEDDAHDPGTLTGPYAASKRRAELAVLAEIERGLSGVILSPTAPIATGDRRPTPPGRLIRDLATGALPALVTAPINLIDARAVAGAALAAAQGAGREGHRYLLCGEDTDLGALAARVAALGYAPAPTFRVPHALALTAAHVEARLSALTGRPPNAPLEGVRMTARRPRFAPGRAAADLGFAPRPLDQVLPEALTDLVGPPPGHAR